MPTRKTHPCQVLSLRFAVAVGLCLMSQPLLAQGIYSCVDSSGKRLTSDRPIRECNTREHRVLNSDGTVKYILPPTMTAEERADLEARQYKEAQQQAAQQEALRRDRSLMRRYPNEASHRKAREAALDDVRKSLDRSERRLADLAGERKPLMDEAEFYVGKPLPAKLRQQMDANDATVEAQRSLMRNQEAELVRINALYDVELVRLRGLWAGAAPGSLGPLPTPAAAALAAQTSASAPTATAKVTPTSSSAPR
jgi:Domain of unknown function (DUF4124)